MTGMADLMTSPPNRGGFFGVTVGVVTNNQDPDGLGRVKVQFPWLSATEESAWARVATPMAGANRGLYCLPEVNDEVLVAFDQGQMAFPYILGALWNGQDKPPAANDDGKNAQRVWRSRSGHEILLDDTHGAEKIVVRDKTGQNEISINTAQNSISLQSENNLTITSSSGNVSIQGDKITLDAQSEIAITCANNGPVKINNDGLVVN